jgi:Putative 2OG-Fe(II) oxygenase
MSPDDLYNLPEMKELVDVIMWESGKVLDAFAVKRDSHYITSMWANITHPNHRQDIHVHPSCFLSGLVYIKTPINCGPTLFASPRKFTKNFEPRYTAKNELNLDFIIIPAEKGRMLIWRGARHGRRNRGPDHRPLQHHDPWPHRTLHGKFELELTDLEATAAPPRGARRLRPKQTTATIRRSKSDRSG